MERPRAFFAWRHRPCRAAVATWNCSNSNFRWKATPIGEATLAARWCAKASKPARHFCSSTYGGGDLWRLPADAVLRTREHRTRRCVRWFGSPRPERHGNPQPQAPDEDTEQHIWCVSPMPSSRFFRADLNSCAPCRDLQDPARHALALCFAHVVDRQKRCTLCATCFNRGRLGFRQRAERKFAAALYFSMNVSFDGPSRALHEEAAWQLIHLEVVEFFAPGVAVDIMRLLRQKPPFATLRNR